jgi:hypothetical protein
MCAPGVVPVPDGFGVLPVFLVLAFLASVKTLPIPAAIFYAVVRVAALRVLRAQD